MQQALSPSPAAPDPEWAEPFYRRDGHVFRPTPSAVSPWDPKATNGIALAGLVGVLLEEACGDTDMTLTRLTIDILGAAPLEATSGEVRFVRSGARLKMADVILSSGGRPAVRASAVLVRQVGTPERLPEQRWPSPKGIATYLSANSPGLTNAVDIRIISGGYRDKGRGVMWINLLRRIVDGQPLTPITRAAMLADFGSGIGSFVHPSQYSYANVDIAMHLLRLPRGEWMVVDADTDSAGNGVALTTSAFYDMEGLFARGHQTLFMEPRKG